MVAIHEGGLFHAFLAAARVPLGSQLMLDKPNTMKEGGWAFNTQFADSGDVRGIGTVVVSGFGERGGGLPHRS